MNVINVHGEKVKISDVSASRPGHFTAPERTRSWVSCSSGLDAL